MTSDILELLCSSKKLDRDHGVTDLTKFLNTASTNEIQGLCDSLTEVLNNEASPWESKHGALSAAKNILHHLHQKGSHEAFALKMRQLSLKFLTDAEVRVRLSAGELLGSLCQLYGPSVYVECKDTVLELIKANLERQISDDDIAAQVEHQEVNKLMEKLSGSPGKGGMNATQIFHDTAGWKCLETSMKALQAMVDGCGKDFLPWINQHLLDLIFVSLAHTNRFVRESGFFVCASLINCGCSNKDDGTITTDNPIFTYGHQFCKYLRLGLSDNWSQVRLAACVACRKFLLALPTPNERHLFYPELIPPLCLNRYYLAEGVRLYSQETWKQIAGSNGRELVEKYIQHVVAYYVKQTEADNHAVREASCSCIAELASKLNPEVIKPYVEQLLHILVICFQDDSWPVRDAACLASGNFVLCFPEESKPHLPNLYPMFYANLEDNITSVRQGAASGLANVVKAFGDEALTVIIKKLEEGLKAVDNQPSESEKYSGLDKGPATFGVVKRLRDNDMDLHTNQTMYSCGSLAPKMSRGRVGGCMDRTFKRPPQPWEQTDGCIYLLSELVSRPDVSPKLLHLIPLVALAGNKKHFAHHVSLVETICKQLPIIAKGVGKKSFKALVEEFLDCIFYGLNCENALTSSAASYCLNQLSSFLGPNILRARVAQHNPSYLQQLDANIHISAF